MEWSFTILTTTSHHYARLLQLCKVANTLPNCHNLVTTLQGCYNLVISIWECLCKTYLSKCGIFVHYRRVWTFLGSCNAIIHTISALQSIWIIIITGIFMLGLKLGQYHWLGWPTNSDSNPDQTWIWPQILLGLIN